MGHSEPNSKAQRRYPSDDLYRRDIEIPQVVGVGQSLRRVQEMLPCEETGLSPDLMGNPGIGRVSVGMIETLISAYWEARAPQP